MPEVESITRFTSTGGRRNLLEYGDKRFYELNLLRIDSSFFQVFDFRFVRGSKDRPFNGIRSMVLTETTARKYFGDENPVGKVIRTNINNQTDFEVTMTGNILRDKARSKTTSPQKLPLNFFRWYCHPKLANHIEGDFEF